MRESVSDISTGRKKHDIYYELLPVFSSDCNDFCVLKYNVVSIFGFC